MDPAEVHHVGKRVRIQDDQVRELSGSKRADLALHAHGLAPFDVADRNTCSGVSPARVMISISRNTDGPCKVPMLPASVPMTTGIPASHTLRRFCSAMAEGSGGAGWFMALATRSGSVSFGIFRKSFIAARICGSARRRSVSVGRQVFDSAYR